MNTEERPDPMRMQIGSLIRGRRTQLNFSPRDLGERLELSEFQIDLYENGEKRFTAMRLRQFADALNVPTSFFFPSSPKELNVVAQLAAARRRKDRLLRMLADLKVKGEETSTLESQLKEERDKIRALTKQRNRSNSRVSRKSK